MQQRVPVRGGGVWGFCHSGLDIEPREAGASCCSTGRLTQTSGGAIGLEPWQTTSPNGAGAGSWEGGGIGGGGGAWSGLEVEPTPFAYIANTKPTAPNHIHMKGVRGRGGPEFEAQQFEST